MCSSAHIAPKEKQKSFFSLHYDSHCTWSTLAMYLHVKAVAETGGTKAKGRGAHQQIHTPVTALAHADLHSVMK